MKRRDDPSVRSPLEIRSSQVGVVEVVGWVLLSTLALVPLLLVCVMSHWARFEADDFSVAVRIERYGLIGAWTDQLQVLNGRFFGYLLVDVMAALGPRRVEISAVLAMIALLGSAMLITRGKSPQRIRWFAPAAVLASAVVIASPAPDQTFLWISGLGMVTASVALGGLAVGLAQSAASAHRRRRLLTVAGGVAAFLSSGAYETTALVLLVSGVVAVGVTMWDGGRPATALALSIGAALGLLAVAVIPGSRSRLENLDRGHSILLSLWEGVVAAAQLVRAIPTTHAVWIGLAAGLLLPAPAVDWRRRVRWSVGAAIGGFGALAAGYSISYRSLGAPPPSRTAFVLVVVLLAFAYFAGWMLSVRPTLVPGIAVSLVVIAVLALHPFLSSVAGRRSWAVGWEQRDAVLRTARPDGSVEVLFIQSPAGLEEVGPDPTSWVNEAVAAYYGVRSVTAVAGSASGRR